MVEDKSAMEQRIDNAIYGAPKIKPDEQRKYLGTFRERVCLTISVTEFEERDWSFAVAKELERGIGNQVFLNDNLPHSKFRNYIKVATDANANFTLKTEPEFRTTPDSLAVVVAAKTAVYQSPIDVQKRYPGASAQSRTEQSTPKKHFWERLFDRKEE
ncbi:YueI family protein [Limosilactobacillus fastidiosus]|uniref:YueI family protein n=1 Tax=Limosilactobacillus fastidiosus TaxID=2759855 RepID=A0A7W3YC47_9LACO|nr:YueI family protein [Limosilactobacillus fastidiosus]MBB1063051.1 YueI family protein [Limosilactobacillus fastidiosus]MBB1085696.1 YueI family protein [Limosilactobacillus fastidiosus]MCD7083868.1 YueI family protein [Limosilactobacillus fastidiosus]MCD7086175.1 YueI family protein [Limosilactobacillus fastidiosus]MCD7114036.1 YueI family protein [Limosilactobacillus fastidiosus]